MLSKTECNYTTSNTPSVIGVTSFTYGNGRSDVLKKITLPDGQTFTPTHDIVGNPSSVMIENGNTMAAMWSYGRRLTGLSSGSEAFSYSYNADGIRTTKTVNGVKHTYALSGTTILNEEWTENGVQHLMMYVYDADGSPVGMVYRNSTMAANATEEYLFVKNIQGDILYVYSSTGNKLVSYVYDAWGNIISTTYSNGGATTAARFNPFTYRGYYRDSETGMYYLNSRYYNPKMGRFISADAYVSTGQGLLGYNMYAYCGNNPVNRIDSEGEFWWAVILAIAVIALPTLLSSCVSGNSNTNDGLYVNEYTNDKGYLSGTNCDDLAKAIAPEIISKSEAINFEQEYGSVIYKFNEGNRYGEDTSVYWISPPHKGRKGTEYFEVKAWDPTAARLPDDITIVGDIHIHFQNASCDANGGFSSTDINAMMAYPGIYYVITQPVGSETKYAISRFNYIKCRGVGLE